MAIAGEGCEGVLIEGRQGRKIVKETSVDCKTSRRQNCTEAKHVQDRYYWAGDTKCYVWKPKPGVALRSCNHLGSAFAAFEWRNQHNHNKDSMSRPSEDGLQRWTGSRWISVRGFRIICATELDERCRKYMNVGLADGMGAKVVKGLGILEHEDRPERPNTCCWLGGLL